MPWYMASTVYVVLLYLCEWGLVSSTAVSSDDVHHNYSLLWETRLYYGLVSLCCSSCLDLIAMA